MNEREKIVCLFFQWAKNASLMESLAQGAWADHLLYQEARRLFFRAFAAMLEAKGEDTDVERALARYDIPERDVHLSWDYVADDHQDTSSKQKEDL